MKAGKTTIDFSANEITMLNQTMQLLFTSIDHYSALIVNVGKDLKTAKKKVRDMSFL